MNEKLKYKIYIDTSDRKNSILSIFRKESESWQMLEKKEGQFDVVYEISKILRERNIDINDVEVEAKKGPGSFTGLRIGMTVSNILNWALGRKKISELDIPEYGSEPNITPPKKFKL